MKKGVGHSTFTFSKVVEKMSKTESRIEKTLRMSADDLMVPISVNWEHGLKVKKRSSNVVGQLAKKVVRKASSISAPRKNTPQLANQENISNSKWTENLEYLLHVHFYSSFF